MRSKGHSRHTEGLICLQDAAEKAELIEEIFDILETLKISKLLSTDMLRCVAGYIIMGLRVSALHVPFKCLRISCSPPHPAFSANAELP